jgi:stage II sporulation protein R
MNHFNHSIFSYRKVYGYVALMLMVLLMSWEFQKVDAALHMENIPEEAIRLRILANSDAPSDQYIKAIVRDAVVNTMNGWVTEPISIDEARLMLKNRESQLQDAIAATLQQYGYTYNFTTTIGQVEFPTKMYGQLVYPAGMYEALLVTLGKGEGRNWWCVLFPPLCFTDAVAGEATAGVDTVSASEQTVEGAHKNVTELSSVSEAAQTEQASDSDEAVDVEVKFFIVELFEDLGAWISSLFA